MDAADGEVLAEAAEAIGVATNNVAEYRGLIAGLRPLLDLGGDGAAVEVRMDSKLVIEQMAGRWKIKNEGLRPLALEAGRPGPAAPGHLDSGSPARRTSDADRLANEAMDAAAKGRPGGRAPPAAPGAPGRGRRFRAAGSRPSGSGHGPPARRRTSGPTRRGSAPAAERGTPASASPAPLTSRAGRTSPPAARRTSAPATAAPAGAAHDRGDLAAPAPARRDPAVRRAQVLRPRRPRAHRQRPAQAEAAAARLSREPYGLEVIVSSPLKRARATAESGRRQRTGLEVVVDEGLRETDFGDWEGYTFTEIQRRWPAELAAWLADPSAAPPGGESFEPWRRSGSRRPEELLVERYEGRTVLVVSHVTPIKMLLRFALLAPLGRAVPHAPRPGVPVADRVLRRRPGRGRSRSTTPHTCAERLLRAVAGTSRGWQPRVRRDGRGACPAWIGRALIGFAPDARFAGGSLDPVPSEATSAARLETTWEPLGLDHGGRVGRAAASGSSEPAEEGPGSTGQGGR